MVTNLTNGTDVIANATAPLTNSSLLGNASDIAITASSFLPLVFARLWDLIAAPFRHTEMLWIIFPLALTFIVLEFYFDRHGDEELGWAAAVANALILLIVAIDLIKHSFHYATPWVVLKEIVLAIFTDAALPIPTQNLILIIFLGCAGVAITVINYYHLLPRKLAFEMSGHPPVNFLAYFAIAIVYTAGTVHEIPLDMPTLVAGALLFFLIVLGVFLIKRGVSNFLVGQGRNNW